MSVLGPELTLLLGLQSVLGLQQTLLLGLLSVLGLEQTVLLGLQSVLGLECLCWDQNGPCYWDCSLCWD
jgi:hypothetical protein